LLLLLLLLTLSLLLLKLLQLLKSARNSLLTLSVKLMVAQLLLRSSLLPVLAII
jgi:hypothetical protein